MKFEFGDEEGPARFRQRIQELKNRLQVAVDADDLKSIESILSENISDSEIQAVGPLFTAATLRLLKYGKNIQLPENALLNLRKGDIDTIISECTHRIGLSGLGLPGAMPSESLLLLKEAVKNYPVLISLLAILKRQLNINAN